VLKSAVPQGFNVFEFGPFIVRQDVSVGVGAEDPSVLHVTITNSDAVLESYNVKIISTIRLKNNDWTILRVAANMKEAGIVLLAEEKIVIGGSFINAPEKHIFGEDAELTVEVETIYSINQILENYSPGVLITTVELPPDFRDKLQKLEKPLIE